MFVVFLCDPVLNIVFTAFHTGNTINIVFSGLAVCGWLSLKSYYIYKNKKNAEKQATLTEEQRQIEEESFERRGNKSPLFYFKN